VDYFAPQRAYTNYTRLAVLEKLLKDSTPELVINCAAFLGEGGVSSCDDHKAETYRTNTIFPAMLADCCKAVNIPLCHLSTACLYDEKREYLETDAPIRGSTGHCGTYIASKVMAEALVSDYANSYILRLRLPFDEFRNERNYLNKLAGFTQVYDHMNSLTHRGDFVKQALELWKIKAPFGIYNVALKGQISSGTVVKKLMDKGIIKNEPNFVKSKTFGSRLSVQKLIDTGIKVREIEEAVNEAITNYV
jgi:dTDP-4-dehydrorhamnose reductase